MNKIQYAVRMDQPLYEDIKAISDKEERSLNQVICLLLRAALKERGRKKKVAKEDHT
jgi:hypothetical protein